MLLWSISLHLSTYLSHPFTFLGASLADENLSIPITKASKISTQFFGLVRWFGPPVLLTGGL